MGSKDVASGADQFGAACCSRAFVWASSMAFWNSFWNSGLDAATPIMLAAATTW